MEDMKGGTFTISNGGVFGGLMSTPIINPRSRPCSACTASRTARSCATVRS
jgi:2-oxoglutarate dehydrogenase E2 component (dihydrolipoamide succinyltransferase)